MVQVLILMSSPRKNGNTVRLANAFNGLMKLLIDRTFAIEKTDAIEKAYIMAKEIKINE